MVYFDIKSLIYQRLNPFAKSAGFQLLVVDSNGYDVWNAQVKKKAEAFGISKDEFDSLNSAVQDYGCIVLLKHSKYYGPSEVASFFSKVGLKADDVGYMKSKNASKYPVWGDFDVRNKMFIYWFPVSVGGISSEYVNEDIEVVDGMYGSKVKHITPITWRGIEGFIAVSDLLQAIGNVWPGQENALFNYGPNGHIYGQVNNVIDEGTRCILTLAPYKNGSRSRDLSYGGFREPALGFKALKPLLSKVDPDATIYVRMKDPTAFGPNAGRSIQQPVNSIDIDDKWGVFLRTDDKHQEVVK